MEITGPTFNGQEMKKGCISVRNFLSKFANCVDGIANDAERFNFVKCSLLERPLLLIKPLELHRRELSTRSLYFKRRIDMDEIIGRVFQYIIEYPPEKNGYSDLGNIIARTT